MTSEKYGLQAGKLPVVPSRKAKVESLNGRQVEQVDSLAGSKNPPGLALSALSCASLHSYDTMLDREMRKVAVVVQTQCLHQFVFVELDSAGGN